MAEQAKVPAIRFAGFTDPWEQRKLGDVTDSFSGGTPDGSHASYYGGSIPFIRSAEINSDKTELFLTEKGLDNSSAKIVERGTVLYALYGATSGEVGIAAIKGAINQAILALSPHTGNDPLFLASWLRREKARIVDTYLQGGQGNLSGSIVKELSFALPQQKEQQVIGSFFSHLDSLITLHQRKYDKLVIFKKSMLEKMFPKDGESVPEIRFAGFTDPWEQRKLSEFVDRVTEVTSDENLPRVEYEDINPNSGTLNKALNFLGHAKKGILFQPNDTLYGKLRPYLHNWIHAWFPGVAIGDFWVLRPRDIDSSFLYRLVCGNEFDALANVSAGSKMPRADWNLVSGSSYLIPREKLEQQTIGSFFSHLDDLITLHQRKLELLQNIKKSLLDKMFV